MKKHSLTLDIIIFSAVLVFCITPGIISQFLLVTNTSFSTWNFPFSALFTFLISFTLFYFYYDFSIIKDFKLILVKLILPSTFCFCILFALSCFFKFFSLILPPSSESQLQIVMPCNFKEWFFCILMFLFSGFYEEVIYRFFVPELILNWISIKHNKKILNYAAEVLFMIIFAAGHIYLGFYAVIMAGFSHFVLRFFYKKTNSIIPGFIAHACYNIISLILL